VVVLVVVVDDDVLVVEVVVVDLDIADLPRGRWRGGRCRGALGPAIVIGFCIDRGEGVIVGVIKFDCCCCGFIKTGNVDCNGTPIVVRVV